jgi:cytochrome c
VKALLSIAAAASLLSPLAARADPVPVGDAARGATLYASRCGACHSLAENGPGPRHAGLLGRMAGTQPEYEYSTALARSRILWSAAMLDRWLANPNAVVPGNKMVVQLANDPRDRADLIAWLVRATAGSGGAGTRPSSGRQPPLRYE